MDVSLRNEVLGLIKPTEEEHLEFEKVVKKLVRKLRRYAKQLDIKCSPYVGGSFGKGTYLKGSSDVDVFMRFDKCYDDSSLPMLLEKILVDAKIKYKKQKGSRDYFSGSFGSRKCRIDFEIIPNRFVKSESEAVNSTDLSPLHVEFLRMKEKENLNLTDEIRLAKRFFKAKGLYGAESYIGGFSGHVIDVLIMIYGSLENLVSEAKLWKESMFADINLRYKELSDAMEVLGKDKDSCLVLIDPIISDRNCARALSNENYARFLLVCNRISELRSLDFEILEKDFKVNLQEFRNFCKFANLKFVGYQIKFTTKGESEDIAGSKLKKIFGKVESYFNSLDFKIFKKEFFIDMNSGVCLFLFGFEKGVLPSLKVVKGPKTFMTDAIFSFLKEREEYFILDDRICVYDKRRVTKLDEVVHFEIEDFEKMLSKSVEFVKRIKFLK